MSYSVGEFRSGLRQQKLSGSTIASLINQYETVRKDIKDGETKGVLIGGSELSDEALMRKVLRPIVGDHRGNEIFQNLKNPAPDQSDPPKKKGIFGMLFGR